LVALADKPPATTVGLRRRAEEDIGRLQTALQSEGYYEAGIALEIDADSQPIQVQLTIDNGPRYRLAAYEISYVGSAVPPDDLQPALPDIGVEPGIPARARAVVAAEQALVVQLQERGYPFAR